MTEVNALKLVPASQNRLSGDWVADDYDVLLVDTGEAVGRIYARISSRASICGTVAGAACHQA